MKTLMQPFGGGGGGGGRQGHFVHTTICEREDQIYPDMLPKPVSRHNPTGQISGASPLKSLGTFRCL